MATTIADLNARVSTQVAELAASAAAYVQILTSTLSTDFELQVGGTEVLNYLQWDYDAELRALDRVVPGYINTTDPSVLADIAAITALEVPAPPSLSVPVAAIPTLDAERPV